ncbi:MAG: beta-lactamase family protein [Bacteroidales bacterium]|nr:beta-lactamase family protein [Bacteroidales bacterium]
MSDSTVFNAIDREVREFMKYWGIQGISLSVMRNDSLMFSKGYGWADKEKKEEMTPRHILRLASVSKLITATGIMKLEEQGRLSLDDRVFGPDGILCDSLWTAIIKDSLYFDITVEHLLRHQGGFSTRGGDPMFSTRTIMVQNRLRTPPDHETLLRTQLGKPLAFVPGETQEYSNFGFLLLSMIIEKVTGTDYETWMQESVLRPAGCLDFHIANNYYQDKYPNEVKYYAQPDDKPVSEYNNSGRSVVRCYGGNDIRALSGAGAWAASTAELCRFVATIDGRPEVPDIISVESVRRMTEWFDPDTFSLGWNDTKPTGEWTRTGTFSGTSALVKYFPDGECWVLVTNTSTWRGAGLAPFTTEMFQKSRAECSALLPHRNMFYVQEESFPE